MQRLQIFIVIGIFGISICLIAQGVQQTPVAPKFDSPSLQRLSAALTAGDSNALKNFWAATSGEEPLIEPIDGQPDFRWITFLWRGDSATRDVSVGLGDIPTPDPSKWRFRRFGDTDVWFKTDRVPRRALWLSAASERRTSERPPLRRPIGSAGRPTAAMDCTMTEYTTRPALASENSQSDSE